ncbi:MAG: glycosyltransferase family 2 protein [Candidatus Marinimicrobia bacterium]|nr:glycosyltransferase family 2 protein [Candidatus Neomarinimicrobiota bacterium]
MLSIVIPIYNETKIITNLYERLTSAGLLWHEEYEVILVDDGSIDDSLEQMVALTRKDARFSVVKLSRNFGHQAAISAGLKTAKGDAVVIMDGDLQDPPEALLSLLEKWREGYEVVYAVRQNRKENIFKRTAYSIFYRLLQRISNIDIPLDSGDFCLMDKKVVNVLNHTLTENIRFVRGLRAYAGFRQTGVTYERDARSAGKSKYTASKLIGLAISGLLGFSMFPLRIAVYAGLFISTTSILIGMTYFVIRVFNIPLFGHYATEATGFATLAVGIYLLGGIILLMLGLLGEYIGRIYIEVKDRPMYIVDEVYRQGEAE